MGTMKLNALLAIDDGRTIDQINVETCFTIQYMDYECHRQLDDKGKVYGETAMTEMTLIFKTVGGCSVRPFYQMLKSGEPYSFYILFNAFQGVDGRLDMGSGSLTALHFEGYTVSVQDNMSSASNQDMMTTVRMVVTNLGYEFDFADRGTIFKLDM